MTVFSGSGSSAAVSSLSLMDITEANALLKLKAVTLFIVVLKKFCKKMFERVTILHTENSTTEHLK